MSKIEPIGKFILSWEGGFVNDPLDRGGATNKGVTLNTWRSIGYDKDGDGDIDVEDLKLISNEDAVMKVLKPHYWDKLRCDDIKCQAIANMLADWAYCSGAVTAAKALQRILGVSVDGVVGPRTINALNNAFQASTFKSIHDEREAFLRRIVEKNPSQGRFLKGWLRRVNSIDFNCLVTNGGETITWL